MRENFVMKLLRSLFLTLAVLPLAAWGQFQPPPSADAANPDGAKAALAMVPMRYSGGILKLSADNGTPNPPAWYILAKKAEGEIFSITIAQGQITQEKPSFNLRALVGNPSPIDLGKVLIGSDDAWKVAQGYSAKKGRELGSVSYALQQKGPDAAPVWAVWCYGEGGGYIGYLEILATTGAVVSSE
jgi:hypothetical protein